MTYQPNIPTGSVPLNQDYLNLQQNFSQINSQFLVDHVPLTSTSGTPPNGYHEAIHMVPVSTTASNPPNNQPINGYTATAGYGQLLSPEIYDGVNTDTSLYYLSGGGRLTQLTRNFQPVAAASGYTSIPGGFVMQWGLATVTGTLAIVYTVPLSSPAYSIQLTQFNAGSPTIRQFLQVFATSNTGFTIRVIDTGGTLSGSPRTIYWTAIGL